MSCPDVPTVCVSCVHFKGVGTREYKAVKPKVIRYVPICVAFPHGIPDEIATGENKHTKAFPGDGGLQYEHV